MSILDLYNPKKIKQNWNRVRGSPYASLKFQYMVTRVAIFVLIGFICYTIINIIIKYDGSGSSTFVTMAIRGVYLVVMVIIVLKAWQTLTPLKNSLKHYETNPAAQKSTGEKIDISKEVDEIFNNIEKNKKRSNLTK